MLVGKKGKSIALFNPTIWVKASLENSKTALWSAHPSSSINLLSARFRSAHLGGLRCL